MVALYSLVKPGVPPHSGARFVIARCRKRCFLHFMALIESELERFVKLAKGQIVTREIEEDVARFVVGSSLRLTVLATCGCGLDIREKRKFASLLMDLVTFRDDVDKAMRRNFLVN